MINYINNNVCSTHKCQAVISVLQWQTYRRRHNCITQPCHSAITLLSRTVMGRLWSLTVTLQLAETLTQEWPDVD